MKVCKESFFSSVFNLLNKIFSLWHSIDKVDINRYNILINVYEQARFFDRMEELFQVSLIVTWTSLILGPTLERNYTQDAYKFLKKFQSYSFIMFNFWIFKRKRKRKRKKEWLVFCLKCSVQQRKGGSVSLTEICKT